MAGDPTRNPYEALGLDPLATPEALTERLREMAEEADPDERARLQAAWRALTLHPADRARAAFFAHPHPSPIVSELDDATAQRFARRLRRVAGTGDCATLRPDVSDLVVLPGVQAQSAADVVEWLDVDPADDPLLDL